MIHLLVLVECDSGGRFTGEIFHVDSGMLVGFSGGPEMLTVMDKLVPPQRPFHGGAELISTGRGRGAAPERAGG